MRMRFINQSKLLNKLFLYELNEVSAMYVNYCGSRINVEEAVLLYSGDLLPSLLMSVIVYN